MTYLNIPNIRILGIEIYYPEYFENIDDKIKEYAKQGIDIEMELKDFFGKQIIHHVKEYEETTLSMSVKVAKKVLAATNLQGKDIDMIALASILPEYLSPPTARLIHNEINGKEDAICYDINANCIGMGFSLNQISQQMQMDPNLNHVLLIGTDTMSMHVASGQPIMQSILGDSACAILLEKTDTDSAIIDRKYVCKYSDGIETAAFPMCGTSHIYDKTTSVNDRKLRLGDSPISPAIAAQEIENMLTRNHLTVNDISQFCFSQLSNFHIKSLAKKLNIPSEKYTYIGDLYGYTGVTCCFFALYYAIQQNKVKRGDYVVFWMYGAGVQILYMLLKY